jgi:hypothetical protein
METMSRIFVHLSDIHFGQEKDGNIFPNNDAKEVLLEDVHDVVGTTEKGKADGVIISGDIAYAGKPSEYEAAGKWLDRLTSAIGCDVTAVQLVPGNHDINRENITNICQKVIDEIIDQGDSALDKYMVSAEDREVLYKRFEGYRAFAEGYNCPLDSEGVITEHRTFQIGPNRYIKFHGLNTALICSNSKKEMGGLLLGARQRVIRSEPGQELIVIGHHPMNWLQDSEDALRYIRNRARVFISGHEHKPSHSVEKVEDDVEIIMLSAGATVPPKADNNYTYCYNILEFKWDSENDGLIIEIRPRIWDNTKKKFVADILHFNSEKITHNLKCPHFKKVTKPPDTKKIGESDTGGTINSHPVISNEKIEDTVSDKSYQHLLLKFFRDLNSRQRLAILIELGSLPKDWSGSITHTIERLALDSLYQKGEIEKVVTLIDNFLSPQIGDKNND